MVKNILQNPGVTTGKENSEMPEISRVTRTHRQARASYDRLSSWYDLLEGGWETPPRCLGLDRLQVRPGERVLEMGCGTGCSLLELSYLVQPVGLDLSSRMLAEAGSRLQAASRPARLVQGDVLSLPFPSHHFDAAFMAFTLELVDTPEIATVLGELRRVLQPGGRLGVVALSRYGGIELMIRLYEWAHARFPAVVDCRPICAKGALIEAGFSIMHAEVLSLTGLGVEVVVGRVAGWVDSGVASSER